MSCLSPNYDVTLPIEDQLKYIGFEQVVRGNNVPIKDWYCKSVCGITINIRLKPGSTRVSLDWRDVVERHLSDFIQDRLSLDKIDQTVRNLSDGVLNIYLEKDEPWTLPVGP